MIRNLLFKYNTDEKFKTKTHLVAGAVTFFAIVGLIQQSAKMAGEKKAPVVYKTEVTKIIGDSAVNPFEEQGIRMQLEELQERYNKGAKNYDEKISGLNTKIEQLSKQNEKLSDEKINAYRKAEQEFSQKLDILDRQYRARQEKAITRLERIGVNTDVVDLTSKVQQDKKVLDSRPVQAPIVEAPTPLTEASDITEFEKMMLAYEEKIDSSNEDLTLGLKTESEDEAKPGFSNPRTERMSLSIVTGDGKHFVDTKTGLIKLEEKASVIKTEREARREKELNPPKQEEKKKKQLLTAGSLIQGVLINGVFAPTHSDSTEEEQPVLMRVKGVAIGPNKTRVDISECFLIGSAIGKLNTGRAYIRGRTLSCVNSDGGAIEVGVSSFAVGSDGQSGIPGNIISRNQTVLWNSTISGALESFAQALAPSEVPVLFDTGDDNKIYQQAGVGDVAAIVGYNGASAAFKDLSDYYRDLLNNLHAVIEVPAGQKIEMILLSGIQIEI